MRPVSVQPLPFDGGGVEPFDDWWPQVTAYFDEHNLNGYPEAHKVSIVLSLLEKGVQTQVRSLQPAQKDTKDAIEHFLRGRYGAKDAIEGCKLQFSRRLRKPKETIHEYIDTLRCLHSRGYPGIMGDSADDMVFEQAWKGLSPSLIRELRPAIAAYPDRRTTDQLIRIIHYLESTDPEKETVPLEAAVVPAVEPRRTYFKARQQGRAPDNAEQAAVISVQPAVNPIVPGPTPLLAPPKPRAPFRCYNCQKEGHMVRECPEIINIQQVNSMKLAARLARCTICDGLGHIAEDHPETRDTSNC